MAHPSSPAFLSLGERCRTKCGPNRGEKGWCELELCQQQIQTLKFVPATTLLIGSNGCGNSPIFPSSNSEIIVHHCQAGSVGNIKMCLGCIVRAVLLVSLALVQWRWLVQKRKQMSQSLAAACKAYGILSCRLRDAFDWYLTNRRRRWSSGG